MDARKEDRTTEAFLRIRVVTEREMRVKTHSSRIWSLATFALLVAFLASIGVAHPAAARPSAKDDAQQARKPTPAITSQQINPRISATKNSGLLSVAEPSEKLLRTMARMRLGARASEREIEVAAARMAPIELSRP